MIVLRSNGLWIRLLCAGLVFAAGCASPTTETPKQNTHTQDKTVIPQQESDEPVIEQADSPSEEQQWCDVWYEAAKEDFGKWPKRLKEDSKATFLRADNAAALLLAGGASIVMHNEGTDDKVEEHFDKHSSLHGFEDEFLNIIGHPATHFAADSLWYFLSVQNGDEHNRQLAWTMRTALSINWVVTMGLKFARDNETPNGKAYAWPSGHTSSSFTVASVLDEFYGPRVGIPAYVVASAVAYRMMDTGDHWASDIVFGATLGWIVGHTVAGRHEKYQLAGFDIVPYVDNTEESKVGVGFLKRF